MAQTEKSATIKKLKHIEKHNKLKDSINPDVYMQKVNQGQMIAADGYKKIEELYKIKTNSKFRH